MPESKIVPLDGNTYKVQRHSFFTAGQDSFSTPPTQNTETFESLLNIMPVSTGVLNRRWGYTLFNDVSLAARRMYSYQNDTDNDRRIVLTTVTNVKSVNEDGTSHNPNIFNPSSPAGQPRMVNSRDYAYFVDGVQGEQKKWNGSATGGVTSWGFAGAGGTSTTSTLPASASVDSTVGGSVTWTNPTNITLSDDTYATITLSPGQTSYHLVGTTYGFSLPSTAIINGIIVTVEGKISGSATFTGDVRLVRGSTVLRYSNQSLDSTQFGASDTNINFGAATDPWNTIFTASDINSTGFGAAIQLTAAGSGTTTVSIDKIAITVYYQSPLTVGASFTGSATVTLTVGRKYYYVYRNSDTGHTGDLSPISASSGTVTAGNIPLSNIIASTDTQVDRVIILATKDGGSPDSLYFLADIPNGTTTLTDDVAETTLLARNIFLETDSEGNQHGVADNAPPPNGSIPLKHRGRLWMVVGQYVYFSKNIEEVTTSTGIITSRYEEAWPASYFFDITEGAETPRAMLSDGQILYVATERSVHKIAGSGPTDFQNPEIVFTEVGVLNQETWKPVFLEGQPVGTMWLTPDFRVIGSDFNTYRDVGVPVQNILDSINTSAASNCCATFFADGGYDMYILAVPTGSNTNCDTLLVYDLHSKQWLVWQLADTVLSLFYNINETGIPQLLFVGNSNQLWQFASTALVDRSGETNATNITATVKTAWQNLGDAMVRKVLNEIEVVTDDAALSVTVQGASTRSEFLSPSLVKTSNVIRGPLGEFKLYLAGSPAKDRFYQFTFTSNSTSSMVLGGYAIEAVGVHRI